MASLRARLVNLVSPVCCDGIRKYSSVRVGEQASEELSRQLEPYTSIKRPQSWPQIRLRLAEKAARDRPITKNRMRWDRRMQKQVQIAKDAWIRRENEWRNEQQARVDAEARWALRRQLAAAEADRRFLFQAEHDEQVQKRLQGATYSSWKSSKRKRKTADPQQEELKREDDQPAPATPRLNRDL